jgi:hypothetical protein
MSITDGFFTSHCPLDVPVSRLVGMPLLVNRMNEMLPWKGRRISGDGSVTCGINFHFKKLNPSRWGTISGSLSVVREDRKLLHPAHIDALVEYCAEVGGSRKIVRRSDDVPELKTQYQACNERLLGAATKQGFESFFTDFMNTAGRAKCGEVASPFEV